MDHINRDSSDNRILNLREATNLENSYNRQFKSISGLRGVYFDERINRWKALIVADRQSHYLGCFKTKEDAAEAYLAASEKYHGEFACVDYKIVNGQIVKGIKNED